MAGGSETLAEKRQNGKELVEDLNKGLEKIVVAARRLPSGDILVTMTNREARQEL